MMVSVRTLVVWMVVGWFVGGAADIVAQSSGEFSFGDSCELVWELHADELQELASPDNYQFFSRFCLPEWPSRCQDYDAAVALIGTLRPGEDSYVCQFIAYAHADRRR